VGLQAAHPRKVKLHRGVCLSGGEVSGVWIAAVPLRQALPSGLASDLFLHLPDRLFDLSLIEAQLLGPLQDRGPAGLCERASI
jgi:hypothetical protein